MTLAATGCEQPQSHGISRDQIEQTMTAHGESLRGCFKGKGHLNLKIHVAVSTTPDGKVDSAAADGKDGVLNTCLETQIKSWTFPKAEIATKFSLPVNVTR
jgi:hypothetical protein